MFEAQKQSVVDGPLDWLGAVALSWLIPLGLVPWVPVTYLTSLVFWLVPIVLLLPRFFEKSTAGGRRRRAMAWTVAYIVGGGLLLDFVFGARMLTFPGKYAWEPIKAIGGTVPVEEVLFYITGGVAIVLVYFWADEHWLNAYSVQRGAEEVPERGRLFHFSGRSATIAASLFAFGLTLKSLDAGRLRVPYYFTFLICVAFIPAMSMFRNTNKFVNWRAFSFTTLYVLVTSSIWEATLALKRGWWGYQDDAMLGIAIDDWGSSYSSFPIEALLVWLAAAFSCVLTYEAAKTYYYDPRSGVTRRLFGTGPTNP